MKRIIVLMLACLMLLSVVPFAVFAEEDVHETETEATTEQVECPYIEDTTKSHNTIETIAKKDPQCGERGYTLYQCECGKMFLDSYVEADEDATHDWKEITAAVDSTCEKYGTSAVVECKTCGKVDGGDPIEKKEHTFAPDKESGEILCEVCHEKKEEAKCENVENGEHNYSAAPAVTYPTCSVDGKLVYACQNEDADGNKCGYTKTVIIEATKAHKYSEKIVKEVPATCLEDGCVAHYTCATCDKAFAEKNADSEIEETVIPALGHAYACRTDVPASVKCINCNETVASADAKADHGGKLVVKLEEAPTCTAWGFQVKACATCGYTEKNDQFAPLGHEKATEVPAKVEKGAAACAPTYAYYNCVRFADYKLEGFDVNSKGCGHQIKEVFLEGEDHVWEYKTLTNANCVTAKTEGNKCKHCGTIDEATVITYAKDPAKHSGLVALVKPDCTVGGLKIETCVACNSGEMFQTTITKKEEHNFKLEQAEGYAIVCGKICTVNKVCKDCGYKILNVEVAIEHDTSKEVSNTAVSATCISKSSKTYICQRMVSPAKLDENGDVMKDAEGNIIYDATAALVKCEKVHTVYGSGYNDRYDDEGNLLNPTPLNFTSKKAADKIHKNLVLNAVEGFTFDCTKTSIISYICNDCSTDTQTVYVTVTLESGKHTYPDNYKCTDAANADVMCTVCNQKITVQYTECNIDITKRDADCYNAGYIKKKCLNENCTYKEETVIEPLKSQTHLIQNMEDSSLPATCITNGYTSYTCKECGFETERVVDKADGHKPQATNMVVTATCEKPGYTLFACECGFIYADRFVNPTGHQNKDKKPIVPSCTDEEEDRICINAGCNYIVVDEDGEEISRNPVITHDFKVTNSADNSTCQTQGYTIYACKNCDYKKVDLNAGFGECKYATDTIYKDMKDAEIIAAVEDAEADYLFENGVVYTPVVYTDGKIEFKCTTCGVIDETKTIVIDAKEFLGDNYGKTLGLTLAVENANKATADFTDSSVVAVTINLGSVSELAVWGVEFEFVYNVIDLKYVGYKFANNTVFSVNQNAVDNGPKFDLVDYSEELEKTMDANDVVIYDEFGDPDQIAFVENTSTVKVVANVANDENGKTLDTIVNGKDIALVTLYFEVTHFVEAEKIANSAKYDVVDDVLAFVIDKNTIEVYNKDEKKVHTETENAVTIEVNKFLDVNEDGDVNIADALAVWKMISGETEVDYNVVADVDKNGVIEATDFMDLYAFIAGDLEYEDMVAIVAEDEAA